MYYRICLFTTIYKFKSIMVVKTYIRKKYNDIISYILESIGVKIYAWSQKWSHLESKYITL